jgi:sterol desaturase/sphingolipid hydroxylase (fatty acid hydroxylase superfamily)
MFANRDRAIISPVMEALTLTGHSFAAFGLMLVRLTLSLVLFSAIFVPLERLFALHPQRIFRKNIATDLGYYFISGLVPSLLLSPPLALLAWSAHALLPAGLTVAVAQWPLWQRVMVALVVEEIGYYWAHRWTHEVPLLWRFHAIHHSAEQMDWLVNTRVHPVDMVFTRLCGLAPLYAVGLATPLAGTSNLVPVLVLLIGILWGFFVHANVRWRFGPLEWLLVTPAFHHWHHTNDGPDCVNKNYAAMFPWVDRMFGTLFLPRNRRPERYGIDAVLEPDLAAQLLRPFAVWQPGVKPPVTPDAPPRPGPTSLET